MPTLSSRFYRFAPVAGLLVAAAACHDHDITNVVTPPSTFTQTNLVADASGSNAAVVDPLLVNAWGIAFSATGSLWVSNNGSGTSTVYSGSGVKASLTVTIPPSALETTGTPTGQLFNCTTSFAIGTTGPAAFIFAGEDGTISAWNSAAGTAAQLMVDRSATGAVYKGIAMASTGGANRLYATDFHNGHIDMFDATFTLVSSFTDATMPAGFAPFGIANIGNQLYVTYAKQEAPDNHDDDAGPGNGYVDVFNADGTFAKRFTSNGALNSPWAVVMAPTAFGTFAGDILVGNFGDGHIAAYSATDGTFIGYLSDASNNPLVIDGLWGLEFGPLAGSSTLYFAAGPGGESHGLLGTIVVR